MDGRGAMRSAFRMSSIRASAWLATWERRDKVVAQAASQPPVSRWRSRASLCARSWIVVNGERRSWLAVRSSSRARCSASVSPFDSRARVAAYPSSFSGTILPFPELDDQRPTDRLILGAPVSTGGIASKGMAAGGRHQFEAHPRPQAKGSRHKHPANGKERGVTIKRPARGCSRKPSGCRRR
jgi:hypothetical protein